MHVGDVSIIVFIACMHTLSCLEGNGYEYYIIGLAVHLNPALLIFLDDGRWNYGLR
jgi:hypothetical protein